MCGISILFNKYRLNASEYLNFVDSLKRISHRGPDDAGIVLINTETGAYKVYHSQIEGIDLPVNDEIGNYNLAMAQKRLSIVDLSPGGHQPKQGKDGSWIVFNGEIYNYVELREELKSSGAAFKTNSDTEVILEAYRLFGRDCLNKFNGMWAFVIWDDLQKKLFISNDRFGVKPLYYMEHEHSFNIVSEVKQLRAFRQLKLELNTNYLDEFIKYGYIDMNEETIYKQVSRFRKSSYSIIDPLRYYRTSLEKSQQAYYTLQKKTIKVKEEEAIEQFREILYDAVRIRMRADVDYGFALSGGLDSSAILYTARSVLEKQNLKNEIKGFSATFPGFHNVDESGYVKIVEEDLGCKVYYSDAMSHFSISSFEKHLYHQDFPVPTTSYYAEWSVYDKVKSQGIKILLNGQGADEVFGGYHHHFYKYCKFLLLKGKVLHYLSLVRQYADLKGVPRKKIHAIVYNEVKESIKIKAGIQKFDSLFVKHWAEITSLDNILLADFNIYQLPLYLRADDRDSMAFSIESRHPFMDYRMVEFGYSLPNELIIKNGWQKYIIRKAMHEMPEAIRYRRDKKGYVTPENEWVRKHKSDFETYLDYNHKFIGNKQPSRNDFYNYALGAWLKVNMA